MSTFSFQNTRCVRDAILLSVAFIIAATPMHASDDFPTTVQSLSPLAHWRLGESSGTTATEDEGGFDGQYINGVTLGDAGAIFGDTDTAAKFDGSNDYVVVPHDAAFLLNSGTLMLWFKADTLSGDEGLFSKDSSNYDTGGHLTLYRTGSDVTVRLQSTTATYTLDTPNIAANVWVQVAFSWGTDGMRLYMNGQLVASNFYVGGLGNNSGGAGNQEPIAIGANSWGSDDLLVTPLQGYFHGAIDEVLIFGYQLSEEQVEEIYNATLPKYGDLSEAYSTNEPIAWWRLNEIGSTTVAVDETGNHDGVYENDVALGSDGAPIGGGNKAAEFDGINDYVDVGGMNVAGSEASFLMWFNAKSFAISDARILSKSTGTATSDHYWMIGTWDNGSAMRLRFRLKTNGSTTTYIASSGDYGVDEWVFAAAVYDGSSMILYQNGEAVGSTSKTGSLSTNDFVSAWIGGNPPGATDRPFDGRIDEVAIFDKALTAQQIKAIHSAGLNPTNKGLRIIKWVEIP